MEERTVIRMGLALCEYMSVRDLKRYCFSDAIREAVREKYKRDVVDRLDARELDYFRGEVVLLRMALALSQYMSARDGASYIFSDAVREAVREKYNHDIAKNVLYLKDWS